MTTAPVEGPTRIINASAPTRICDIGGWTDTWFAEHGSVVNIAVTPGVRVQLRIYPREVPGPPVVVSLNNYGHTFYVNPGEPYEGIPHSQIKAAFDILGPPEDQAYAVSIYSDAPPGSSMGTSAAVMVALVGALRYALGGRPPRDSVIKEAHLIETNYAGLECGIQDHVASVMGGISCIGIKKYPDFKSIRLSLTNDIKWELQRRLMHIYLGATHDSSEVHKLVIEELKNKGPEDNRLEFLRTYATMAFKALMQGDLVKFGACMINTTGMQGELHPSLVSELAQDVIRMAQQHGAIGWKVNGAGGHGGSLTLLMGHNDDDRQRLSMVLKNDVPQVDVIPVEIDDHGLRVWEPRIQP